MVFGDRFSPRRKNFHYVFRGLPSIDGNFRRERGKGGFAIKFDVIDSKETLINNSWCAAVVSNLVSELYAGFSRGLLRKNRCERFGACMIGAQNFEKNIWSFNMSGSIFHNFCVSSRRSGLMDGGYGSAPRGSNRFFTVADGFLCGAPHQGSENPQEARYEYKSYRGNSEAFCVKCQIRRVTRQFPVTFGVLLTLFYILWGTLGGYLFYYKRLISGAAIVGSGFALLLLLGWLI